jgi:acetate kinase
LIDVPLVGLFEPAFHRTIPDYAYTYGIPHELAHKHGIRKYGFHGASHRYISERAPIVAGFDPQKVRLISCHLGGSSSICAILNGSSIEASMGFSPQSGVLNAVRCGDLDPFVPLFLQKAEKMTVDEVAHLLNTKSGLLGISGVSGDMKQIIEAAGRGEARAELAIKTFCHGVRLHIGSYFVALGGCDLLVFTGGIGEKSPVIRAEIARGLECLGVSFDHERNEKVKGESIISAHDAKIRVAVVPTNEELIVAREVKELMVDIQL